MADGKWIEGLRADMPITEAAHRVLKARLGVVRERLPHALFEADKDPEHVHQLRVGTRRAAAAVGIFAGCLPAKRYGKIRKRLRKIRRAAGEARDWDVFLETLAALAGKTTAAQNPGLDFLAGYGTSQRAAAQTHLIEINQDKLKSFDELVDQTLTAVQEPSGGARNLVDLAGPLLGKFLRELEQAAGRDLQPYEHLHQVRILGKRLRYAMEIFASCFAAPFREVYYPAVEEMQEILGLANDSFVARQRLEASRDQVKAARNAGWKRLQPGFQVLLRFHARRLPEQRKRFQKWWKEWQRSGAESAFADLLKNK